MIIHTKRLVLRPPKEKDLNTFTELAGSIAIAEQTFVPHPYSLELAEEYFEFCKTNRETGKGANFVILRRKNNELLGSISYKDIDDTHRRAEFGYWIGKPYWGNGYATEAIKALIRFGFEDLSLHRVYATPFGENKASQRVLEKAGMIKEGVLCDHVYHRGKFKDFVFYGITNSQYKNQ